MPPTVAPSIAPSISASPSLSPSPSSSISSSSRLTSTPTLTPTLSTSITQTTRPASTSTNSSPNQSDGTFGSGSVPLATIFYFIAFVSGLIALVYIIHRIRQSRLRRLQEQDDANGGRTRYATTYRPEDSEECPPPQYRAYALDEPSLDPEMTIIYPDQTQYASSHLGLLSVTPPFSSPSTDEDSSVNAYMASARPPLQTSSTATTSTTTTTTTPTITTTTPIITSSGDLSSSPSSSPTVIQRSIMAPNANILTSTPLGSTERLEQQQHTGDYMPSVPVIRAPSPAFTFAASRNPPILRNGPAGNNSINQSGSGRRSTSPISSTDPTSNTTADALYRLPTPDIQSVSQIHSSNCNSFDGSTSTTGSGSGSGNGMVEGSSNSQSGQHTQHPVLNRLRSQGPPPYIPVPPEAALPRLPPEYNTAIAPLGNPSSGSP